MNGPDNVAHLYPNVAGSNPTPVKNISQPTVCILHSD